MPTYDYKCRTCGITFEHFQSITSDALKTCPPDVCPESNELKGKGEVERLISAGAGLLFKGSGFYLTDYARNSESSESSTERKAAATASKAASAESKESSTPKADTAEPAKKTEPTKESKSVDSTSTSKSADTKSDEKKSSPKPKSDDK